MDEETDDRMQDVAQDEIDGEDEDTSYFSASSSVSESGDENFFVSLLESNHIVHLKFPVTEWLDDNHKLYLESGDDSYRHFKPWPLIADRDVGAHAYRC